MKPSSSHEVSELLVRWRAGSPEAFEDLVPLVYEELRNIARYHLRRERPNHTLQSAALVNEAYLRLVDRTPPLALNRAHFLAVASRLMRQILVDHARGHDAAKRGADCTVPLDSFFPFPQAPNLDLLALDDALNGLARIDEQQGRIVEMKFFGGLETEEIAQVLGISISTVKRDWNVAKAWLSRQMRREAGANIAKMAES